MRFSIPSAFALLLCVPLLSGCEDTQARDGRSGSTATISQNGDTVTSSTGGGDGQVVIRRSGGGSGYDGDADEGSSRGGGEADAERLMDSMRNRAGNALER